MGKGTLIWKPTFVNLDRLDVFNSGTMSFSPQNAWAPDKRTARIPAERKNGFIVNAPVLKWPGRLYVPCKRNAGSFLAECDYQTGTDRETCVTGAGDEPGSDSLPGRHVVLCQAEGFLDGMCPAFGIYQCARVQTVWLVVD